MVEVGTFFAVLGAVILGLILLIGILWVLCKILKVIFSGFGFWLKYSVFRKKKKEEDLEFLRQYRDTGMTPTDIEKFLLINNIHPKRVKELLYLNKKEIKMKGGKKNE